jgi:hypothetical protein
LVLGFGIAERTEAAGDDLIVLDVEHFELAVPHATGALPEEIAAGDLALAERHIDDLPAAERGLVRLAFGLKLPNVLEDVEGLAPGAEHLPVRIGLDRPFGDLCQCRKERLAQGRAALRGALAADVLSAADELVVVAARGTPQDRRGDLVAPEALGDQPILVHLHKDAAGRVDDRHALRPQSGLLECTLDVEVDHVSHVLQGLPGAGLATVIHLRLFDRAVRREACELHILAAHLEDRVDLGIAVLDAKGVAGDLVGDAVRQRRPLLGCLQGLLLAQQNLLVEFAGRAGRTDAPDHDIVFVSRQIAQDAFEGFLGVAVRFDIELVKEPAAFDLDQSAFGRRTTAVDAENNLRARRDLGRELLAALVDPCEAVTQRRRKDALLTAVLGHLVEQLEIENKTIAFFQGLEGRPGGGNILMVFRPNDRHTQQFGKVGADEVIAEHAAGGDRLGGLSGAGELAGPEHVDHVISRHRAEQARQVVYPRGAFVLFVDQVRLDHHTTARQELAGLRRLGRLGLRPAEHLFHAILELLPVARRDGIPL